MTFLGLSTGGEMIQHAAELTETTIELFRILLYRTSSVRSQISQNLPTAVRSQIPVACQHTFIE